MNPGANGLVRAAAVGLLDRGMASSVLSAPLLFKRVWVAALAASALGCASTSPPAPASVAARTIGAYPLGLWAWRAEAPAPGVRLELGQADGVWRAMVDGDEARVSLSEGSIRVEAANGSWFIGQREGADWRGYWHQPSTRTGYAEMVTQVKLAAESGERWSASFRQQPRPFRMFLDVFEKEEAVAAVLRNPERNEIVASAFRVERDGEGWQLVAREGAVRLALRRSGSGLVLEHPWLERVELSPAEAKMADGYLARPAGPRTATRPVERDDGWPIADDAGFVRGKLDALVADIAAEDPRDRRVNQVHAVLASRRGELAFEEYFHGYDREAVHDVRSLSKVLAPVMIGAMRAHGAQIDEKLRPIPAVLGSSGVDDPRKADINLGHLMTYTSGLDCDEAHPSAGSEDRMWDQTQERSLWRFTSSLPLLHPPGERYAYCSGSMNLVGSSIRAAGGRPIIETFDALLAQPLDFEPYHWNLAPDGSAYLGGGAYIRPRDVLKVGAVFAAGGTWKGRTIVDPEWVERSTTAKLPITPETSGLSEEDFGNAYVGGAQAFGWRVDTVVSEGRSYACYEATGNGGQVLVVVPELELAVVFMGGNYRQFTIWGKWRQKYIGGFLIPALYPEG